MINIINMMKQSKHLNNNFFNLIIISGIVFPLLYLLLIWLSYTRPTGDDYCAAAIFSKYGYINGIIDTYLTNTPFISALIGGIGAGALLAIFGLQGIKIQAIFIFLIVLLAPIFLYKWKFSTVEQSESFSVGSLLIGPILIIGAIYSPITPPGGLIIEFFTWIISSMRLLGPLAGILLVVALINSYKFSLTRFLSIAFLAFWAASGYIETLVNLTGVVLFLVFNNIISRKKQSLAKRTQTYFSFLAALILTITLLAAYLSGSVMNRVQRLRPEIVPDSFFWTTFQLISQSLNKPLETLYQSLSVWLLLPFIGGVILNIYFFSKKELVPIIFSNKFCIFTFIWTGLTFEIIFMSQIFGGYSAWWHYTESSLLLSLFSLSLGGVVGINLVNYFQDKLNNQPKNSFFIKVILALLVISLPILIVFRFYSPYTALKARAVSWDSGEYTMIADLADEKIPWVQQCIKEISKNSPIKNDLSIKVGGSKLSE